MAHHNGQWTDGLLDYLSGEPDYPPAPWLRDGGKGYTAGIADRGNSGPMTKEDRVYFLPADIKEKWMVPKWAVVEIMKAMGENRRVFINGPDKGAVDAIMEDVVLPQKPAKPSYTSRR